MSAPRFVLYTRVSTQAQDQNNSHPTQLAALEAYAQKRGGEVVEVIRETASGAGYLRRPGIRRAIELLESDDADVLACFDFSRYSRDGEHQQAMLRRVEQIGKRIEFTTMELARDEHGHLTPEGRLMFGVHGSFAEYHRAKITADSTRGMINAAKNGQQPCRSRDPYGYTKVKNHQVKAGLYPEAMRGKYVVVEEQAAIVREIFALRCQGKSAMKIMEELNARGVPAPRAGLWHEASISRVLKSRLYVGEAGWRNTRSLSDEGRIEKGMGSRYQVKRPDSERIVIPCPAIVEREVWTSAQQLIRPQNGASRPRNSRGLLTGLLRCPLCGDSMTYISAPHLRKGVAPIDYTGKVRPTGRQPLDPKRYEMVPLYVCVRAQRRRETRIKELEPCPRQTYKAQDIERRIVKTLRKTLAGADLGKILGQEKQAPVNSELRTLQSELEALQAKRKIVVDAQIRALSVGADPSAHEELLVELSNSIRDLSTRISGLEHKNPASRAHLVEMARRIDDGLDELAKHPIEPDAGRKWNKLLATIIEKIEFEPTSQKLKIHFH